MFKLFEKIFKLLFILIFMMMYAANRLLSGTIQKLFTEGIQSLIIAAETRIDKNSHDSNNIVILTNVQRSNITTKYFITQFTKALLVHTNHPWFNPSYFALRQMEEKHLAIASQSHIQNDSHMLTIHNACDIIIPPIAIAMNSLPLSQIWQILKSYEDSMQV